MATINQLIRKPRRRKVQKNTSSILDGQPQKKGTCIKVTTVKPKKPNSALRKMALVKIVKRQGKKKVEITVQTSIKGERKNNLKEHDVVLIQGGGAKDLPGCRFKTVAGALDDKGIPARRRGRSRYGAKRPKAGATATVATKKK